MVSALQKKMWADLRSMTGQVVTISAVVGVGIAGFVAMQGSYVSLFGAAQAFRDQQRLADVFVHLTRAPTSVAAQLQALPGVSTLCVRVVATASLPMEDLDTPAWAQLLSLPRVGLPPLNGVLVTQGRLPDPHVPGEVAVLQSFFRAHSLKLGDRLPAVLNGVERRLTVVGEVLSPEFAYPVTQGSIIPDHRRAAVLWMAERELQAAFDLDGAFNDVALSLQPDASLAAVTQAVDRVLAPYGGLGAYGRERQMSYRMLEQERTQLRTLALQLPAVFLLVAAFILNTVLSRLIQLQRTQVATLKALGYGNTSVAFHYLQTGLWVVLLGSVVGIVAGVVLGRGTMKLYQAYFLFPGMDFVLDARTVVSSILVSLAAGLLGGAVALRNVVTLSPATAMQAPAPTSYKRGLLHRLGVEQVLSSSARMTLRQLERHPGPAIFSTLGVAFSCAILVASSFMTDALDAIVDLQFGTAQQEDVLVTFNSARPLRAVRELQHLPGVELAEGLRTVPVRLRHGAVSREVALNAYALPSRLRHVVDINFSTVAIPEDGVVLTRKLADILNLRTGDVVGVESLEGELRPTSLVVAALADEPLGLQAHAGMNVVARWLREEPRVNQGLLQTDRTQWTRLNRALQKLPQVGSVLRQQTVKDQFQAQYADLLLTTVSILTVCALILALGVIYNNARVALSQRSHELATLRVLGFTTREIANILTGELVVQLAAAVPLGLLLGTWLAHGLGTMMDPELFRLPMVINPRTYAFASVVTLTAGLVSVAAIRRRLRGLDLINVLKTRE